MTLQSISLRESRKQVEVQEICAGGEGDCEVPLSLCIRFFVKHRAPTQRLYSHGLW